MSRTFTMAAALAVAVSLAFAHAPARADTLAEALAAAYETNPQLIAARAGLRATDEQVNQARAGMRPRVSGTIGYDLEATDGSRLGADRSDPFSAGVEASQSLYDGGQTFNAVRGRIADVSAARARLAGAEQDVLLAAVQAYVDVLRDEEFVDLARNNVRVIAEQLRASEDRFEVGEVTRTDVSQARARLAEANANLASFSGQLERSRQIYREVIGTEPQTLASVPPLPPLPVSQEEAVAVALENHPEVIAARFEEISAARDVRAQIGGLLPSVSLRSSVGYNDSGIFANRDSDQTSASIGVQATIPFYQGGAQYSRVRQAQALASEARATITTAARNRRRATEAAWSDLLVARATIRAGREQVEAAQLAFEGVREEAIVGSRTTLDVLDAEQELLNARTQLVASIRDEYVAGYNLLAAVGALTAADRGLTVAAYDPEINYDDVNDRSFGFEPTDDTVWEEFWRP